MSGASMGAELDGPQVGVGFVTGLVQRDNVGMVEFQVRSRRCRKRVMTSVTDRRVVGLADLCVAGMFSGAGADGPDPYGRDEHRDEGECDAAGRPHLNHDATHRPGAGAADGEGGQAAADTAPPRPARALRQLCAHPAVVSAGRHLCGPGGYDGAASVQGGHGHLRGCRHGWVLHQVSRLPVRLFALPACLPSCVYNWPFMAVSWYSCWEFSAQAVDFCHFMGFRRVVLGKVRSDKGAGPCVGRLDDVAYQR